jgi:hypothetical protein
MSNKYFTRNSSIISRDESSFDRGDRTPSWFNDFAKNLEKESAKPKSQDYSLFDQINSILGNKSKYSTVAEAVEDMQKRTGLYDILQRKQASASHYSNIQIFKDIPVLKTYIDNYIDDRPGTSVEAVIHDLLKIKTIKEKLPQSDDVPLEVKKYINDKIMEVNKSIQKNDNDNFELGKLDLSEDTSVVDDPLGGCEPNNGAK